MNKKFLIYCIRKLICSIIEAAKEDSVSKFKGILADLNEIDLTGRWCGDYEFKEEPVLKKSEEQFEELIAEPQTPETIEEFEEDGVTDDYLNDLYDDADFALADAAITIFSVGDEIYTTQFGSSIQLRGLAAAANDIFKASL
jgi:hypothetical protein